MYLVFFYVPIVNANDIPSSTHNLEERNRLSFLFKSFVKEAYFWLKLGTGYEKNTNIS